MNKKTTFKILNIVCIVLLLALFVGQFLPFWTSEKEETTLSINEYLWNAREHKDFSKELKPYIEKRLDLTEIGMSFAYFVLSIVAVIMILINPHGILSLGLPVLCGFAGIYQFLGIKIFRLGQNWTIYLAVFCVLAVISILRIVFKPKEEFVVTPQ